MRFTFLMLHWFPPWNATLLIHMADSPSEQDKTNPVFLLATRAGTMVARDILRWSRQEKLSFWPDMKSFIDQAYSVKMAWYRPHSFLRFYWPRQRKKELVANIQPCWPNTDDDAYRNTDGFHVFFFFELQRNCVAWLRSFLPNLDEF